MPATVHVVRRFVAKLGKEQALKTVLNALIAPSRRELGCYQYDLLENPADPREFCCVERWENEKSVAQHCEAQHLKHALSQVEALVDLPPDSPALPPDLRADSMIGVMRQLGISAALLLGLACSAPAQQQPSAPPPSGGHAAARGGDAAARIGTRTVTMKEIEDRWRENNPQEHAQAIQAVYDGRRAALDAIVAELLIEQAAKAQGVTPEQYTEAEVTKRVETGDRSRRRRFLPAEPEPDAGPRAAGDGACDPPFLEDQQRATAQQTLVAELRTKGPAISVLFDAPRSEIAVAADDAALGAASAPVTVVEFSDFQCPFCQRVSPTLKQLKDTYGDKIRIVWKDFPLTAIHPEAYKAAEAGNCAREQGKFWEYHDRLFANQQALQPDALKTHAVAAGLDATKFNACLDSSKYSDRVQEHVGVGARLGINSTPAVFINGRQVTGAQPYEVFAGIIDEELERAARR